ncbi:bifunctional 2-C-methyl-D-erythritol 4-phosphate cytidylyltransferase/2-C-methyl-D-erythritol 2,4-cyclodiphosphate synthase [Sphingomonas radiodurans]|uniref:bifunctional 2-C-methyl-D-erythritol 4-phosphate cytidylyltransferase/2-C-methyl-D-erythritol 2,4-cyclodiphosphate synthase n=1 Tax=Sphingomonas radiodurans TaxID=2890321 RepID=UPI001E3876D4|nr:bifunctional 2-C-methyl-D-erythritol 4-phosphate cytidylyltransferase/2-C-methyl-D-erythritol 2,4-cyclodiphosphate synthase [Sphingomonas radiodurans]WBH16570.1 bifunctional 2-C-methyl-D-erythritol 4-phosphate cytidylyltransferase/2-C-methyl-D-erythritol 2,4-cyclodiphosphate synthase [Sphingomonas radiodurans]
MKTVALIVAAGKGERTGTALPKQYALLAGRPMLAWSHEAFCAHPAIDAVVVAIGEGQEALFSDALPDARYLIGGASRRETVQRGLVAIGDADQVLIHDAARPFVTPEVIDRLLAALATADGAIPVRPVVDTLVTDDGATVPRDGLSRVQTPQAFRAAIIRRAHEDWTGEEPTDDAQMVRALGGSVALVQGNAMLEKVTWPGDFAAAEARIGWETRTATGFDVHRLEDGEELWLGGVLVPHTQGLSGHSDADVALHALTDALLGTIAAGDIGQHFPPSDPQWRGAESGQFLRHAASLVAARGGQIMFVDLTLICEAPKIGPHRPSIQARIAELLGLSTDRVSVKATTTERLGFTGRGEGIAAQAAATIRLPGRMA